MRFVIWSLIEDQSQVVFTEQFPHLEEKQNQWKPVAVFETAEYLRISSPQNRPWLDRTEGPPVSPTLTARALLEGKGEAHGVLALWRHE